MAHLRGPLALAFTPNEHLITGCPRRRKARWLFPAGMWEIWPYQANAIVGGQLADLTILHPPRMPYSD
jgi:hypothetical protein